MSNGAPVCPTSFGQPVPGSRVFNRGAPWSRPGILQDLINTIPPAHDLRSAIHALNIMNSIIQQINHGEPVVNNTHVPGEPDTKLKGEDHNPNYLPVDWVEERREYITNVLHNPDNDEDYIEVKTLKTVYFYNPNTDYRLTYFSKVA
jgi:hypothetical protein